MFSRPDGPILKPSECNDDERGSFANLAKAYGSYEAMKLVQKGFGGLDAKLNIEDYVWYALVGDTPPVICDV